MLKVFCAPIGSYATNCYIITDEKSGKSAAVDCSVFSKDYERLISISGVKKLDYILVTHGHFDHICGVTQLKNTLGGSVCIMQGDERCLFDERYNLNNLVGFASFSPCNADIKLHDGDKIELGSTTLTVLATPGHTPGGCCFDSGNELFTGDTLFCASMGRTDFPRGSESDMYASLQKLAALPGERDVYPGHGEKSTLSFERKNNPYIKQIR